MPTAKPKKTAAILLRMTTDQKKTIAAAATKAGVPLSTWLLMVGLRVARGERSPDP